MGEQKGKVIWSLEDYLKKAELAIKDQTLRFLKEEIIRTERKPDWVWRKAKRKAGISVAMDLDVDSEVLASSYWALAKLKRDFPEEFKKIKFELEGKEMGEEVKIEVGLGTLIQTLEERGLKVRVCGNCEHFIGTPGFQETLDVKVCDLMAGISYGGLAFPDWEKDGPFAVCKNNGWQPKEVSEKKIIKNKGCRKTPFCIDIDFYIC